VRSKFADPPGDGKPSYTGANERRGGSITPPKVGEPFNPYGMFNGIWVPEALLRCPALSPSAKLLYGRLARFAGENGSCFPSIETLASELGMTGRRVQRLVRQLCDAGFLKTDRQYRANGSQTSNAYVFLYHPSLVPTRVVSATGAQKPYGAHAATGGDKNVTGGQKFTGRATAAPPLEESQLNSGSLNSSSSSAESTASIKSAAALNPEQYPLSAARFREFFPRTTAVVITRILRAILVACPGSADEDIAAAVYVRRDQNSPGLWALTLPDRVREVVRPLAQSRRAVPECGVCGDAGVVWDSGDRAAWCPGGCAAAQDQLGRSPRFVAEWNAQFRSAKEDGTTIPNDRVTGVGGIK